MWATATGAARGPLAKEEHNKICVSFLRNSRERLNCNPVEVGRDREAFAMVRLTNVLVYIVVGS
jgi:hypothetical protein